MAELWRRNRMMRRGELLHMTNYGNRDCDCWVIVDEADTPLHDGVRGKFIWGDFPTNRDPHDNVATIDRWDVFKVIRPDRVPDHVIAEIARLALLGELGQ